MQLRELLKIGAKKLGSSPAARLDAELLLASMLGINRSGVYAHLTDQALPTTERAFRRLVGLRKKGVPTAYLVGQMETLTGPMQVDPRVLIPRSSTELLIQAVVEKIRRHPSTVADIGTGSGVIAITLAKALASHTIEASDVSPAALQVAQHNARQHGVYDRITWRFGSLLEPWRDVIEPTVIVANLPYVPSQHIDHPDLAFEPRLALHGGNDGLRHLHALIHQLSYHPLVETVALECQPDQVDTLGYWLRQARPSAFRVSLIKDGPTAWGVIGQRY